jgi:hypothetical protein
VLIYIVELIKEGIKKLNTNFRNAMTPERAKVGKNYVHIEQFNRHLIVLLILKGK